MNEGFGRELRTWILFVIGCGMIVALTANWILTGETPDTTLGGISLVLVGFGNILLQRGGGSG